MGSVMGAHSMSRLVERVESYMCEVHDDLKLLTAVIGLLSSWTSCFVSHFPHEAGMSGNQITLQR